MAVCDANYRLIYFNCGAKGRVFDGTLFDSTSFCKAIKDDTLNVPKATPLPGRSVPIEWTLIGDAAFTAGKRMLKPVGRTELTREQRIFNYRVSRARRTIENTFGIMTVKWRLLGRTIEVNPNLTAKIISVICCLHNLLIDRDGTKYTATDNDCECPLAELKTALPRPNSKTQTQNEYMEWFLKEGAVPWQWEHGN